MSERSHDSEASARRESFEFPIRRVGLIEIQVESGFQVSRMRQLLDTMDELYRGVNAYQYYVSYLWERRDYFHPGYKRWLQLTPEGSLPLVDGAMTPAQFAAANPPAYPLVFHSAEVRSPGEIGLLGDLNPITGAANVITAISEHKERMRRLELDEQKAKREARKDSRYRNREDERQRHLENEKSAAEVQQTRVMIFKTAVEAAGAVVSQLRETGLSAEEILPIYMGFLGKTIQELGVQVESGLIGTATVTPIDTPFDENGITVVVASNSG